MPKPSKRIASVKDFADQVRSELNPPAAVQATGVDLATWRAQRAAGIEKVLPSGLTVRLKVVKLQDLILAGAIPQTLDALVKRATTTGFGVNDIQEFAPLINSVFTACLVDPKIGERADETHAALSEFDYDDRLFVFAWANGAAEAVRPFPAEATRRLESASTG